MCKSPVLPNAPDFPPSTPASIWIGPANALFAPVSHAVPVPRLMRPGTLASSTVAYSANSPASTVRTL